MLQMILPDLMGKMEEIILSSQIAAWLALAVSFFILAKSTDLFVDSAVSFAAKFNISKLVIGLVLVSFATTAPELCVSLTATLQGNPAMARGNAVGSVICNTSLALGAAGIVSTAIIRPAPDAIKVSGSFLVLVSVLIFIFVMRDLTLSRMEGIVLIVLFFAYLAYMFREYKTGKMKMSPTTTEPSETLKEKTLILTIILFLLGLAGILVTSEFIVISATSIANFIHVPNAVIALTIVTLGTSIPEVATCVISARKGYGEIAVGTILGANILNICWVAGASSVVRPLYLKKQEIFFMFPVLFVILAVMLIMLRFKYSLTHLKGGVLLALYAVYIIFTAYIFPPSL